MFLFVFLPLLLLGVLGPDRRMLPPEQVADQLGVTVRTLYAWRQAGTGPPAVKLGKYIRLPADGLRDWLAAQENESRRAS